MRHVRGCSDDPGVALPGGEGGAVAGGGVVPGVPGQAVAADEVVGDLVALVAHAARMPAVRQLEANLARLLRADDDAAAVRPGRLRSLSRSGMRSYMRYYAEAFQLPGLTPDQVGARVRAVGLDPVLAALGAGRSVVGALTHSVSAADISLELLTGTGNGNREREQGNRG